MRSVSKSERDVHPAQVYRRLFVPSATDALTRIHGEMDAAVRYVISSTWRKSFSREQLEVVFRRAGIGFAADRLHEGEKWRTPPQFGPASAFTRSPSGSTAITRASHSPSSTTRFRVRR